jgi:hypothetical protein
MLDSLHRYSENPNAEVRETSQQLSRYIALNTNLISLVSFAPMVIVWLDVPNFSC